LCKIFAVFPKAVDEISAHGGSACALLARLQRERNVKLAGYRYHAPFSA
jgi:hypothetical protein